MQATAIPASLIHLNVYTLWITMEKSVFGCAFISDNVVTAAVVIDFSLFADDAVAVVLAATDQTSDIEPMHK